MNKEDQYIIENIGVGKKEAKGFALLLKYFRPHWKRFTLIVGIVLLSTITGLIIPSLVQDQIDSNLITENPTLESLLITLGATAVLALTAVIATFFQMRTTGFLGQDVLYEIRRDIFCKIQELPMTFFAVNKSGDIIARLTSDVDTINRFLSEGFIRLVSTVFNLVFLVIIMFALSSQITAIVLVILLVLAIFILLQGQVLRRVLKRTLDQDALVSNHIQEITNGFPIIKAFGSEREMRKKFVELNRNFFGWSMISNFINSLSNPLLQLTTGIATVLILVLSLQDFSNGVLSAGTVVAYSLYLTSLFNPIRNIADLWKTIQDGIAASQRIAEVMSLESNINEIENSYNPDPIQIKGEIIFKDVCFSYDGEVNVLEDVSLNIKPDQTVAIVGPTGGGKTSLVNLIARLYDVDCGSIKIDGEDVKDWKLTTLRRQIGYLLQDTFLFADSVFNNLRYANEGITEEEAWEMLERIGARDFVENLPEGINSKLEPNGANLSIGQRQLLAITRLLLRNPKILILDEATANIDTKTEQLVQKAIEYAASKATSLVIAHRLSTIKDADLIILVQDNVILESGTLEELLKKKGKFSQMYQSSRNID